MIRIKADGKTIALIIKAKAQINGFVTNPNNPLQLGYINFPEKHQVKPHQHRALTKTTHQNQEFIYVQSGRLAVTFFNKGQSFVKHILNPGDCLLQLSGGHGFKFLQPTKIITIKQGPYSNRQTEKIEI